MATAAFRSSTRRSTFVDSAASDASSSNRGATLRHSRSLSRCSDRLPPPSAVSELDESPTVGVRPSNNSSGSVFPEISLDDLANEFFLGRSKEDDVINADTYRRGRSVSRCVKQSAAGQSKGFSENGDRKRGTSCARLRRQRSVSMARQRFSDSEDFSSTLTDDEVRNAPPMRKVAEKITGAVSANNKTKFSKSNGNRNGFHEAMAKEARLTVEEIQTELEQSDKRKEDLLAKLEVEQQRNQELAKIVKDLLPGQKPDYLAKRRSCLRRRGKDKLSMSKCLIDEAEKHIDEFLSNIEDADISSFDGDRSDTSSTIGGNSKFRDPITYNSIDEIHQIPVSSAASPAESEGILLPWLHLETSNEVSSSPRKHKSSLSINSGSMLVCILPEASLILGKREDFTREQLNDNPQGHKSYFGASRGSKGITGGKFEAASEQSPSSSCYSSFFMDELQHSHSFIEDIAVARYMHRQQIESGSLVICGRSVF